MMMDSAKLGDVAHALTIGNALAFAYAVVRYANSYGNIFDPVWAEDGFCVSNKDVPYWNSHDLCLYVGTIMSVLIGLLYLTLKDAPGMTSANLFVKDSMLGIFGHGLSHGGIARAMRQGKEHNLVGDLAGLGLAELVLTLVPLLLFWPLLLKAAMNNWTNKAIGIAAIPIMALGLMVPPRFGFAYVQTVLLLAFSLNQLSRPAAEKDFAYALFPIIVSVPISLVGWIESTACSNFVIDLGGHLLYDAYIPISIITFYIICWVRGSEKEKKA